MFIKVFVPNSRGKIELTVEELEELLSDACEKAVREKCATCNRGHYGGVTYLNTNNNEGWDWTKVTCSSECIDGVKIQASGQCIQANDTNGIALMNTINDMIGDQINETTQSNI